MERRKHWNQVYTTKDEREVSWFEALPEISLEMLDAAGMTAHSCVLDVGGGDSHLVDALAARGLDCLAVLDVSGAALERARTRMGPTARIPVWIEADVTGDWTLKPMDIWHDRAVFHFLTDPDDRATYRNLLRRAVAPGGTIIVATFATDGPEWCSGLPVRRYDAPDLAAELGPDLTLVASGRTVHHTPSGATQPFTWVALRR